MSSHVQLLVTPGTVTTRLLCPCNFPGKNTEWIIVSFSRGSSQPRARTHVSCISCISRWIPYQCTTWEGLLTKEMAMNLLSKPPLHLMESKKTSCAKDSPIANKKLSMYIHKRSKFVAYLTSQMIALVFSL